MTSACNEHIPELPLVTLLEGFVPFFVFGYGQKAFRTCVSLLPALSNSQAVQFVRHKYPVIINDPRVETSTLAVENLEDLIMLILFFKDFDEQQKFLGILNSSWGAQ